MSGPDTPVVVCLGGGGVGKTTLAAAVAIAAARRGERVVVLTIDPARRLASTLGLDRPGDETPGEEAPGLGRSGALGNEPILVQGPWTGELWAATLDPEATMWSVLRTHVPEDRARRIVENPLFTTVVRSLSGSSEYLAAERLHQLHHDPRFDRVVIDTPPSRHAIDFLDSPDRLARFLGNRLYRLLLAPRSVLRPMSAAAQVVVRLTARLVGADLIDNVVRLFADTDGLDDGFRRRARETSALLAGPDCGYLVITTAQREPLAEARWIVDRLGERRRHPAAVVVNRCLPVAGGRRPSGPDDLAGLGALLANWDQLAHLNRRQRRRIADLESVLDETTAVLTVDEQLEPPISIAGLDRLAESLPGLLAPATSAASGASAATGSATTATGTPAAE